MTAPLDMEEPAEQCVLDVTGMDCASCVAHVTQAAQSLPGVRSATVNLARGRAVVDFDPRRVEPQAIAHAITDAGYPAQARPAGHAAHAAHAEEERLHHQRAHARAWLFRAVLGIALWLPVELTHWILAAFGAHPHHATGPTWLDWVAFVTATTAMVVIGGAFFRSAWNALRHRTSNMDTLIALGTSVAYGYSLVALAGNLGGAWHHLPALYFMESTGLLALISLGHWLEARARDQAGSAIRELLNLTPVTAQRVRGEGTPGDSSEYEEVPVASLRVGDRILIRPGDRVPVDGEVVAGRSDIDESMITGEPIPVLRELGSRVIAGTLNQTGRLVARATQVGSQTALAQIVQLVEQAQNSRPPVQQLADRIAAVFVPVVLGIALLTAVAWYVIGSVQGWPAAVIWAQVARTACSVLIIACPCALGLAVPAALMVGTGRGARRGILIRDIDALQHAERVNAVVLDKTGTITRGRPVVSEIVPADGIAKDELLRLAAVAEQFSGHPLAKSIVEQATARGLRVSDPDSFDYQPGMGVTASVEGQTLLVGNAALLQQHGIEVGDMASPGHRSVVHVARKSAPGGMRLGTLLIDDEVKPDSRLAIAELHQMGLKTVLLTGDNEIAARAVAVAVGIEEVHANVRPADKARVVSELRQNLTVAMVGDGINDAPALANADLGIAIGSGSDIAKETGGIVLVSGSLGGIATALRLSRATMRTVRQNLVWAFLYNVLAIPLAALGLLTPLVAAGAMALSDVTVIGNALLLRRARIDGVELKNG